MSRWIGTTTVGPNGSVTINLEKKYPSMSIARGARPTRRLMREGMSHRMSSGKRKHTLTLRHVHDCLMCQRRVMSDLIMGNSEFVAWVWRKCLSRPRLECWSQSRLYAYASLLGRRLFRRRKLLHLSSLQLAALSTGIYLPNSRS